MDPNHTLTHIRKTIAESTTAADCGNSHTVVELIEALDQWLSQGGFLPDDWQRNATAVGALTSNDHILTRAGRDLDDPYDLPYALGVCLHVYAQTPIFVRLHRGQNRAVVNVGAIRP